MTSDLGVKKDISSEKDIGNPKSDVARETLIHHNSDIQYISYPEKLTLQNAFRIFADYDVIIDASDNFQCKYLTSDVSRHLNIPLVFASVYQFAGQLSLFNYQGSVDRQYSFFCHEACLQLV